TCSQSLQRVEHGEQPLWAGVVLAALLGQIGLPGGGFAYALGSTSNTGKPPLAVPLPTLPLDRNRSSDFIPVARIRDIVVHPAEPFDYNGRRLAYPDIKLVYWAGGNPFHHHQDLNRLREAFARPDTVIFHDSAWTASARHADIVLPATITLEREDMGGSAGDPLLVAMDRAVPRHPEAGAAYDILYNDRGACLAGAVLSGALRPGVVQLSTGAWYDPENPPEAPGADNPICVHGNPNVLTRDAGTSKLAQGCTGQLTVIEIERFDGPLPPVRAFDPP